MMPARTILHPTDFSDLSQHAFTVACRLAREDKARLVVLHVAPMEIVYGGMVGGAPTDPNLYLKSLEARLREFTGSGLEPPLETKLVEGEPVSEILAMAEALDCDLIVMGSHGRSGLSRLFMGSVAEGVMRGARCQVLTVKAPSPAVADAPTPPEPAAV